MATQESLYIGAILHLNNAETESVRDETDARYWLGKVYSDALAFCLRQGFWNFAMKAVQIESDVTPEYGYTYGFYKPDDWARTYVLSSSDTYDPPLMDYQDQNTVWLTDVSPIYVRYVSTELGADPSLFPMDYAEYVSAYLASKVYKKVTGAGEDAHAAFNRLVLKKALATAKGNDAIDQAPGRYPQGSWVSSRGGWGNERGKRGQLIG
jgi:hypothetical protein